MSTKDPPKGASLDRGDGRDAHGRFVNGGAAPVECFWKAVSALQRGHPDAINSLGDHISSTLMWWVHNRKGQ